MVALDNEELLQLLLDHFIVGAWDLIGVLQQKNQKASQSCIDELKIQLKQKCTGSLRQESG
jgi:hypothetical protein